jgi:hypothetical protein
MLTCNVPAVVRTDVRAWYTHVVLDGLARELGRSGWHHGLRTD